MPEVSDESNTLESLCALSQRRPFASVFRQDARVILENIF